MRTIPLGTSGLSVPVIAVGCMRIKGLTLKEARDFLHASIEQGANFFDHADIYGGGECEEIFANALEMTPAVREKLLIQSKCGIRKGMYDFSQEHILSSVEGSLKRLKTDYLDVLLLHRPDTLMEPEEVAEAFDKLHASGKVRHFGVSNHDPYTIQLLQKYVRQPLVANQMQLSLTNATMISQSMNMNILDDKALDRDNGILHFCRLHDITIQPWSPFQYGFFEGVFLGNEKFVPLNAKIAELAEKYGVSDTTIVMAWLLRHPAKMQPVTGTMNKTRLADCIKATEVTLSREDWYALYLAAGHRLP
ncbi:MAG TPA: aldo/keto reductase family oxidoreductase [Clostridiales bacterium]|nr:aldo/keto reductase family oxidoreductase [Clostridiales bacterium]